MSSRQLDSNEIYNSLGQRLAKQIHLFKARTRHKERPRVEYLSRYIPHAGVILDVGAHFGYFSKEFARIHDGTCHVHAFEPMAYNLSILRIVTRHLDNVEIHPRALSDTSGTASLAIPVKSQGKIGPGLAHLGEESERKFVIQPVETIRLDDIAGELGLSRVDFIKIDVEGAELPALRGAESLIRRCRPVIFAEVYDKFTARIGYRAQELFAFLKQFGYSAELLEPGQGGFSQTPASDYEQAGDYLFRCGDG